MNIKKVWCQESGKYITDKTRNFQSEIHNRHQQSTREAPTVQSASVAFGTPFSVETLVGVEIIVNQKLYIKLKINPTSNLEYQKKELVSKSYFPRFKYQLSYLAKLSKIVNGEEKFKRWIQSDLIYNHIQQDVHLSLLQKLDDEQLEGSGFQFQEIEEVILEIYQVRDIQAPSYIELPGKYKDSKSIINLKNNDQYCFLWCILAYFYPVEDHKNRTSFYSLHMNKFNLKDLEIPMKVKDIPKFERLNKLYIRGHGINVLYLNSLEMF